MNPIWLFPVFLLVRRVYVEVRDRLRETFPSSRRLVQADFDKIAAADAKNRAEGKTKKRSLKEVLERVRSRSSRENAFVDEHLAKAMLSLGAARLPEMSQAAVWAWASHVKKDPLIQSAEASKLIEREIAAYAKFGWAIPEEPFEDAGNLCYLVHVGGMNVRMAAYEELKSAEAGQRWVAPVEDIKQAYEAMHQIIRKWYSGLGYPR